MRERWGLSAHQQLSPALQDKLAYFATVTGSYAAAAALAAKVGYGVEDSTVQALVQRVGARAEEQTQARLKTLPSEQTPTRGPTPLGVLMLDGYLVRHRGPGWGLKSTRKSRVEWHEEKVGVFYRHEQSGAGQLTHKVVVSWQGEPSALGRRLHWEAQRAGLGRAQESLAVGDGAAWIWNLVQDRWGQAHQLLDFYHASQHLHALGEILHPRDEPARRRWIDQQLRDLRHGKEQRVLRRLAALPTPRGPVGEVTRREQNYFAEHAGRMNYQEMAARGWPIGSGAVESACNQKQGRLKRRGQFWTQKGLRHLNALMEARDNGHWEQLWMAV